MTDTELPVKNIYQRINAVMRDVSSVSKQRYNQHHRYNYVGHDDVTIALQPAFAKHGIVQEVTCVSATRSDINLALHITVSWVNIDSPTDRMTVDSYGESFGLVTSKGARADEQQYGKAMSYALKLAQLKCFALIGDDTPDTEGEHGAEEEKPQRQTYQKKTEDASFDPKKIESEPGASVPATDAWAKFVEEAYAEYATVLTQEALTELRASIKKFKSNFSQSQMEKLMQADKACVERIKEKTQS